MKGPGDRHRWAPSSQINFPAQALLLMDEILHHLKPLKS